MGCEPPTVPAAGTAPFSSNPTTGPTSFPTTGSTLLISRLSGVLLGDITLTSDRLWLLRGGVFVGDDVTASVLTIEPGTFVVGEPDTLAFLTVRRGSRIEAVGTPTEPIVFSASFPVPGTWGGLVLNGRAPINSCATLDAPESIGCETVGGGGTGLYGGDDPLDSSGTLRYVRIQYAGMELAPGHRTAGLALHGVGRGTAVDHVHVHASGWDAVRVFGGTVDLHHLLWTDPVDDGLDWDFGWAGNAQFLAGLTLADRGNHAFEGANHPEVDMAVPRSSPTLANVTVVHQPPSADTSGVFLQEGTTAEAVGLVVAGYAPCLSTSAAELTLDHSALECAEPAGDPVAQLAFDIGLDNVAMAGLAEVEGLGGLALGPDSDLDTRGFAVPSEPWFENVSYRGAVDPQDDWVAAGLADGWIVDATP